MKKQKQLLKGLTKQQLVRIFGVAVVSFVLLSLLYSVGLFSNVEVKLTDNLYGGKRPLDNIVIIEIDDRSIQEFGRWPFSRTYFAEIVEYLHQAKVVAIDVAFFEESTPVADQKMAEAFADAGNIIIPVEYTTFKKVDGKVVGDQMLTPPAEIRDSVMDVAYVNIITDPDGVTRALKLDLSDEYDNFAVKAYQYYWKKEFTRKDSRFLVNFVGAPGSFKRYSFADVANGNIQPSVFEDKIVLIGATSPDLHDDYFVPTSGGKAMPGVEIHANAIQTMINKDFLGKEPDWSVLLKIFLFSILVVGIFYYSPVWLAPILNLVALIIYFIFAIKIFEKGIIVNIVYIPAAIIVSYMGVVLYFYMSEKKERAKVLGAFEKYVSPKIIQQVMKDPKALNLGGEKRTITVFFSDIRGFTTLSEGLTPEQLVHLLNEYLSAMTQIIMKHDGVVDKYMGDAIMAFWNAPMDQKDHALLAARASFDMEKKLKELQAKWKKDGIPSFDIGIGLNSGPAVVGNMGSYDRFDYTAMGDTVNLGSRLEGLNKPYNSRILISESTKKLVQKEFMTRKIDKVAVKGKKEPVIIYELAGSFAEAEEWYQPLCDKFEEGVGHYFDKEWDKAIHCFKECLKIRKDRGDGKDDGPSVTFIERCEIFKKTPPPKDWDGVWVMKTK
ncbi:TPA: adenylate/guanylate cyclase domain-containing protein [Candidatus Woesearchaeota archaeon]|nr:adenylate/guanylate cyclase domain-containing protein [Candidatus Woesearchaeota archaeon]